MQTYIQAAKSLGYLKKGSKFKKLPKKGSSAHKKIVNAMKK